MLGPVKGKYPQTSTNAGISITIVLRKSLHIVRGSMSGLFRPFTQSYKRMESTFKKVIERRNAGKTMWLSAKSSYWIKHITHTRAFSYTSVSYAFHASRGAPFILIPLKITLPGVVQCTTCMAVHSGPGTVSLSFEGGNGGWVYGWKSLYLQIEFISWFPYTLWKLSQASHVTSLSFAFLLCKTVIMKRLLG